MGPLFCLLSPVHCATTSIATSTLGDLFGAVTGWLLASVHWFLGATNAALAATSEPSTVVRSATPEFNVLLVISPLLMMVGLLVATLQAVRHGDAGSLWRVYLGVAPACVLAIAVARPLAFRALDVINQLCSTATGSLASHEPALMQAFSKLPTTTPGFGLFVLALGVVVGSWLLWCELIVRAVVLTLLLVLVPVVVPLATFPALRRLGWRLAETFTAIAMSKFLIVVALALGLDELRGSSATEIITGAVTLVMACASPFLLLRIIPFVEQSALHHLEGLRQRATRSVQHASSSPAGSLARSLVPSPAPPGPPTRPADLGLEMWETVGEFELPPLDATPGPPPIGTPELRDGHVAHYLDEGGPVVGWHFDE